MVTWGGPRGPVPRRPAALLALLALAVGGACGTTAPSRRPAGLVTATAAGGRVALKVGPAVDVAALERRWAPVAAQMRQGMGDGAFRDMMRDFDRTHPLLPLLRQDRDHAFYRAQLRCRDGAVVLPTGSVVLTVRLPGGERVTCRDTGVLARVRDDPSRLQDSRRRPVVLSPAWDPAAAADGIYKLVLRCDARGEVVAAALDTTRLVLEARTATGDTGGHQGGSP